MHRRVVACLAGLASFFVVAPAQSQAYTFLGIPWGTPRASVTTRFHAVGIEPAQDYGRGRVEYHSDSSRVYVSFDGDRLVGVRENYELDDAQGAVDLFQFLVDSLQAAVGEADSTGVQLRVWNGPAAGERIRLEVYAPAQPQDGMLPVVFIDREGPGYAAFMTRLMGELQAELYGWIYERAPADRWEMIFTQDDRGVLYERARARRTPAGTWRVWMRTVLHEPVATRDGAQYDLFMSDDEIDCAGRRSRSHTFVTYLGSDVVASETGPDDWNSWLPETVGESVYEAFCQRMRTQR